MVADMDEISFMILARAGTDDPLPEFVCGVDYRQAIVLDELLRTLSRLVDEGLLTCRLDGRENKDWASQESRTGIQGELVAYVKRRIQMDEWMKADMSKYPQYVFSLTPTGAELLDRFFVERLKAGASLKPFGVSVGSMADIQPSCASCGRSIRRQALRLSMVVAHGGTGWRTAARHSGSATLRSTGITISMIMSVTAGSRRSRVCSDRAREGKGPGAFSHHE
jgi:hypothetical protein